MRSIALLLVLAIQLCAAAQDSAQAFAPGVLSAGNVYRGCFTPDGDSFYFFKKVGADSTEDYRIFRSDRIAGGWSEPNTVYMAGKGLSELYPEVSADGQRMVFTTYRPAPGDSAAHPSASVWYADRAGDGWGTPVHVASAAKSGYYHAQPSLREGRLIFNRISPDWETKQQLVCDWRDGAYTAPALYGPWLNWTNWRTDLYLEETVPAPDGSFLLLIVTPRDGSGRRADLWVSFRQGTDWTEPRPLGAGVNTTGTENFPFFSPDGRTLYFVRDFNSFYQVDLKAALGNR